jgi:hypothetical protein
MNQTLLSTETFYQRLTEKVSNYNARLLLSQALHQTGLTTINDQPLEQEVAKNLCLELIKRGGPAFHVGQAIYRELQ